MSRSPLRLAGTICIAHTRRTELSGVVLRTPKGILVLVMAPRLRVGTECSGMELVPYALNKIGLRGYFRMAFICERDGQCRKLIRPCHRTTTKPRQVVKDVVKRKSEALPDHDMYVAGFPCQPFSVMGVGEGLQDSRGREK